MRYILDIPPASADRLESKRTFTIEEHIVDFSGGTVNKFTVQVPEEARSINFEFDFKPEQRDWIDGGVRYTMYIKYENSTGSRTETKTVEVRPFPKCIKCEAYATYCSPEDFCDEHWAEWWAEGVAEGPEDFEIVKEEALRMAQEYSDAKEE